MTAPGPASPARIGVDLGGTKVESVALDGAGRVLARRRVPTPRGDYPRTLDAIAGVVRDLEAEIGSEGTVGVGIPGAISPATGLVKKGPQPAAVGRRGGAPRTAVLLRQARLHRVVSGTFYPGVTRLWDRWAFSDRLDTRLVPPAHGDSSGVRGAAWLWSR